MQDSGSSNANLSTSSASCSSWDALADENNNESSPSIVVVKMFDTTFLLFTREFRGQRVGAQVDKVRIATDSAEDLLTQLFHKIRPYIKREIRFEDDKFSWSDAEIVESDMER